MTKKVTIIVGTPGSGKTWVANQIRDTHTVVDHDSNNGLDAQAYAQAIAARVNARVLAARLPLDKPVVAEAPFSLSKLQEALSRQGIASEAVFITEQAQTVKQRYEAREGKPIPAGYEKRIETFKKRATEQGATTGTAKEVLDYLRRNK
jgi:predicted kinase